MNAKKKTFFQCLFLVAVLAGEMMLCASTSVGAVGIFAAVPRERILLDDRWWFQLESKIVTPSGDNTLVTDWIIKESPDGEADAGEMTNPHLDVSRDWTPAKTGEDLTAQHKDKFVWYRAALDPLFTAHPVKGARSIFFVAAGPHVVVFLNGHKVVEHSTDVRNLKAGVDRDSPALKSASLQIEIGSK